MRIFYLPHVVVMKTKRFNNVKCLEQAPKGGAVSIMFAIIRRKAVLLGPYILSRVNTALKRADTDS